MLPCRSQNRSRTGFSQVQLVDSRRIGSRCVSRIPAAPFGLPRSSEVYSLRQRIGRRGVLVPIHFSRLQGGRTYPAPPEDFQSFGKDSWLWQASLGSATTRYIRNWGLSLYALDLKSLRHAGVLSSLCETLPSKLLQAVPL